MTIEEFLTFNIENYQISTVRDMIALSSKQTTGDVWIKANTGILEYIDTNNIVIYENKRFILTKAYTNNTPNDYIKSEIASDRFYEYVKLRSV